MVRANEQSGILIGSNQSAAGGGAVLPLRLANRHGLIAGATGTGKTITLQRMAECVSAAGVPVFFRHAVTRVAGTDRVTEVSIQPVDGDRRLVAGFRCHG